MNDGSRHPERSSSPSQFSRVDHICDAYEAAWRNGSQPSLDEYLQRGEPPHRGELFEALLELTIHYRQLQPGSPAVEQFLRHCREKYPQFTAVVDRMAQVWRLAATEQGNKDAGTGAVDASSARAEHLREFVAGDLIGRYLIEQKLDEGSFGAVYLGLDKELDRKVAIKVSHEAPQPKMQDMQLLEARVVARFDHPHIVQVYDVGRLDDGRLFIISKFIDGSNLKSRIHGFLNRPREAARLLASIAEALDYAHERHVYHRDVKPANILIDCENRPYLADFGLALRDDQRGEGAGIAGTPAYMSPEQARGESHLVDRRSDVFSLAAVLYELAAGQRAFSGPTKDDVLRQVMTANPQPPVEVNPDIPTELERIILKGLRKRAGDRYETAAEMAADLRAWCDDDSPLLADARPKRIVSPRGLSPYDAADADVFLRLLPGPRTRAGFPESIDYWKTRLESRVESRAFRVGVLYGPSGSGKSSFFLAGLKPRLDNVVCCFVRCAPGKTDQRWLQVLRAEFPELGDEPDLIQAMRRVRGELLPPDSKLLIVLDQFEQWLSTQRDMESSELVAALRQCDGVHTQTLLLVRDDFWAALTHCLRSVDVEMDANNSAMIDVFDRAHACAVLIELGRGYGAINYETDGQSTANATRGFVDAVISEMLETGPLIPVRIALFAHSFRDETWTLDTLRSRGGVGGVISLFLDDVANNDPLLSGHRIPFAKILNALLPPPGKLIKDRPRGAMELSELSGIDLSTCQELLTLLESRYPIVAASDAGLEEEGEPQFQLAHDFLVPIARDWTSRTLRSTRQGRTESMLVERAVAWQSQSTIRHLPSLVEWLSILLFSRHDTWSGPAKRMMQAATRWHASRMLAIGVTVLAGVVLTVHWSQIRRAESGIDRLLTASQEDLPEIVAQLNRSGYVPARLSNRLEQLEAVESPNTRVDRQVLHARLGLMASDAATHLPTVMQYLGVDESLPDFFAAPTELLSLSQVIAPYHGYFADRLWQTARAGKVNDTRLLRSLGLLARVSPHSDAWHDPEVVQRLVAALLRAPAVELATWSRLMMPLSRHLTPILLMRVDMESPSNERENLIFLLAEHGTTEELAHAVPRVAPKELARWMPVLRADRQARGSLEQVWRALSKPVPSVGASDEIIRELEVYLEPYQSGVSRHAAFAFAIPWNERPTVLRSLRASGYIPLCYRPYQVADNRFVAVGWRYAAIDFETADELSEDDLEALNQSCEGRGMRLVDVAYDPSRAPDVAFSALWWKFDDAAAHVRLSVDKPLQSHAVLENAASRDAYVPTRCSIRYADDGTRRVTTVWRATSRHHTERATRSYFAGQFRNIYPGYLAEDLQYCPVNIVRSLPETAVTQFLSENARENLIIERAEQRLKSEGIELLRNDESLQDDLDAAGFGLRMQLAWGDTDDRNSMIIMEPDASVHLQRCRELLHEGWWPNATAVAETRADSVRYGSIWHREMTPIQRQIELDSAAANIAISLAEVGKTNMLAELLHDQLGRQARTLTLDRLGFFERLHPILLAWLQSATNERFLCNLLQALAEYDPRTGEESWRTRLADLVESPSSAVSASAQYAARRMGYDTVPPVRESEMSQPRRQSWFTNSLGHVMIQVAAPPDNVTLVGAPCWDPDYRSKEIQHVRAIDNDFALSSTEVTERQYRLFLEDPKVMNYDGRDAFGSVLRYAPELECPRLFVNYPQALLFCQWLSEREAIPESEWCYPGIFDVTWEEYVMPENILDRTGYRLPTEAEYEFACRAGSTDSRHFGWAPESLARYGWHLANSAGCSRVVGSMRPNELGFFDLLGNAREWCHDADRSWFESATSADLAVNAEVNRAVRGGGFESYPSELRSAYRATYPPASRHRSIGFRVARTIKSSDASPPDY